MAEKITLNEQQKKDIAEDFAARIPQIRSRREPLTLQWERNHSAWRGVHTRSFFKSDIFDHFVPAARRAVERFITRGAQMLIPSSQFFEVYPADELSDEAGDQSESVLAFLLYIFRKRIKTYPFVKKLLRCYSLYGRAVTKSGVKIEEQNGRKMVWPSTRVVDPFVFFVWPENVSDIDDAQIIFEDNFMPWETYLHAVDSKLADPIDRSKLTAPVWPHNINERLSKSGLALPDSVKGQEHPQTDKEQDDEKKTKPPENFVHISEVWMKRRSTWWFIWLLWNVEEGPKVVRVSKETFLRHPYRQALAREVPGEQYTTAMMDDIEPLQVLFNDQINMTLEGQATSFSPPVAIDIDMVSRAQSLVYKPRAKWFVKPEGVQFLQPQDTTRSGYTGIAFTQGLIDAFSGSSPLAEGQPTRNLPRAGFAVSSLLNLSLADIRDAAQSIEDGILTPTLGDLYRIAIDLVPAKQIFKIPGTENFPSKRLKIKDLEGDYDFTWVGSLQSQDFQVRSTRLIGLLETIGKFAEPIGRDLQLRGKRINWTGILTRAWREGLGERGADSLIEDLSARDRLELLIRDIAAGQAQQGAAGGAPGQPGPTAEPPVDVNELIEALTNEETEGLG